MSTTQILAFVEPSFVISQKSLSSTLTRHICDLISSRNITKNLKEIVSLLLRSVKQFPHLVKLKIIDFHLTKLRFFPAEEVLMKENFMYRALKKKTNFHLSFVYNVHMNGQKSF